jgi:hypothetical protein
MNPARGQAAGLGNVCLAASYVPENTQTLIETQAEFLRNRFGLSPDRAALVASLVFREARQ